MIGNQPSVAVVAVLAIAGSIAVAAIGDYCYRWLLRLLTFDALFAAACDRSMTSCVISILGSMDVYFVPSDAKFGLGSVLLFAVVSRDLYGPNADAMEARYHCCC